MAAAVERQLSLSRQRLEALAGKRVLQSPMNYLQDKRMTLEYSRERLSSASQRLMQAKREQFVRLTAKLDAMKPLKVLSRGYSVVGRRTAVCSDGRRTPGWETEFRSI